MVLFSLDAQNQKEVSAKIIEYYTDPERVYERKLEV